MFEIWDPRLCWVFIIPVFAKNKIHGCQADLKTQLVFAGCAAESTRLWINLFQLNQTCRVPRGFFGMLLVGTNNRKRQIYGARNKSEHKCGFKCIPPFVMSPNTRRCHSARGENVNGDCRKRLCGVRKVGAGWRRCVTDRPRLLTHRVQFRILVLQSQPHCTSQSFLIKVSAHTVLAKKGPSAPTVWLGYRQLAIKIQVWSRFVYWQQC